MGGRGLFIGETLVGIDDATEHRGSRWTAGEL